MNTGDKRRAGDYILLRLDAERTERMWSVIEARSRSKPPAAPRRAWLVGLLPAAALLGMPFVPSREAGEPRGRQPAMATAECNSEQPTAPQIGQVLLGSAAAGSLHLPDGSRLALGRSARVAVEHLAAAEVGLRLLSGEVRCLVSSHPARNFDVRAGDVQVRAKGSAFTVRMTGGAPLGSPQVQVTVSAGELEIRAGAGDLLANLGAEQSWSGPALQRTAGGSPQQPPEPRSQGAGESAAHRPARGGDGACLAAQAR